MPYRTPEEIAEMRRLRFQEELTTTEIGLRQNPPISRERVRQLIGNTGRGFVTRRKKKLWRLNKGKTNAEIRELLDLGNNSSLAIYREGERHEVEGGNAKIGYDHQVYVSNVLKAKGIENELGKSRGQCSIILKNLKRVQVLSARPLKYPGVYSPMYSFNTRQDKRGRYCDFFICVCSDTLNIFVIPARLTRVNSPIRFCYPNEHWRKSKWMQYYGRYDLLEAE